MGFLNRLGSAYGALRLIRNAALAVLLPFSAMAADKPVIVMLGDSLTAGYGLPPEAGLVPRLQAHLDGAGVAANLINAGVSGDTTAGGLSRLDWSLTPDVRGLVVILGGNDLLRGLPPEESRANLSAILKGARARGLPVLLVPMKAPGNFGPEYEAAFDAIYPDLAAEYGATLGAEFFSPLRAVAADPAALARYMQADGIHPNAEGVAVITGGLGPELARFIAAIPPGG